MAHLTGHQLQDSQSSAAAAEGVGPEQHHYRLSSKHIHSIGTAQIQLCESPRQGLEVSMKCNRTGRLLDWAMAQLLALLRKVFHAQPLGVCL